MSLNIDEITGRSLQSVSDLIDLDEELRAQSLSSELNRWAFRGQPAQYGSLVPSFRRQFTDKKEQRGAAEIIESELIAAFREHYALLNDRSSDMPLPESIGMGHDLRCLSVMQHYEIPTRLLDWTSDYWTAVYFACAGEPQSVAELWHYDRRMFSKQQGEDQELRSLVEAGADSGPEPVILGRRDGAQIVELDPRLTPRMIKQAAHHTVSTNAFADHLHLLHRLQKEMFPEVASPRWFLKHTISSECKPKALQFLAKHKKITASTIFPDVVGLGRFLRWQLESQRTMLL